MARGPTVEEPERAGSNVEETMTFLARLVKHVGTSLSPSNKTEYVLVEPPLPRGYDSADNAVLEMMRDATYERIYPIMFASAGDKLKDCVDAY